MANQLNESTEKPYEIKDLSGGPQEGTSDFMSKENELGAAESVDFGIIGGVGKGFGYLQRASDVTSSTTTSTSTSTTTTSTSSSTSSSTSTSTTTTA